MAEYVLYLFKYASSSRFVLHSPSPLSPHFTISTAHPSANTHQPTPISILPPNQKTKRKRKREHSHSEQNHNLTTSAQDPDPSKQAPPHPSSASVSSSHHVRSVPVRRGDGIDIAGDSRVGRPCGCVLGGRLRRCLGQVVFEHLMVLNLMKMGNLKSGSATERDIPLEQRRPRGTCRRRMLGREVWRVRRRRGG